MLLPDNIHPEHSIYFNAAVLLKILQQQRNMPFFDLYLKTKAEREMSMPVFVLCLDWLFLLNLISLDTQGVVELCS